MERKCALNGDRDQKKNYEIMVAYTSTGVSMAWVKEQQIAPEKAYLATSDTDKPGLTGTAGARLATRFATYSTSSRLSGTLEMAGDAALGGKRLRLWHVGISVDLEC